MVVKTYLHKALIIAWSVSININACIIPNQLGCNPFLEPIAWFIKKLSNLIRMDIASDGTALALKLSVNGP